MTCATALAKKKRVGKKTISAKQVRKVASGRKRRKSDGTQPSKTVFPGSLTGGDPREAGLLER